MSRSSSDNLSKLRHFSKSLGWQSLREFRKTFDEPFEETIVWYSAGEISDARAYFALQINTHPLGSSRSFSAAVHCIRYRICSGWHTFLCIDSQQAKAEAARLHSWLSRDWFSTIERRRAYRLMHPECAGYTWQKLRNAGEPHYPGIIGE